MPVGKNALKRVTNNGYSKVNVSAPDMEHSEVLEAAETPKPKTEAVSVKTTAKKNTAPKTKKAPTPKPRIEKLGDNRSDGFVRYGFGEELPVHLL